MEHFRRVATGLLIAMALAADTTSAARAADGDAEVPADVADAYSSAAIANLRDIDASANTADGPKVPDIGSAALFGVPRQIHLWSPALIAGEVDGDAVAPLDEWLAPIVGADGDLVGTYRVWRPTAGSTAEYAGYNDDDDLARALDGLDDRATLVSDPTIDAWYAVRDGVVTALNASASREVPSPASVDEMRGVVSTRYAEAIAGAGQISMHPLTLGIGAMLLVASAAGAVVWATARRRAR
ncbi:hypothetical protein [Microbacterium sp. SLBN-111]|uniref:hypothetical protein n=1 Tax=Microbacterium sp. SLBN-111 TaxID=3377733 RepID=UPI003C726578